MNNNKKGNPSLPQKRAEKPFFTSNFLTMKNNDECLHKQCSECHGTGRKSTGEMCVHMILCPCPVHSPVYLGNKFIKSNLALHVR